MQITVGSEFASYKILRHIGGGGMAQIYLAKTKGLAGFEKYLALKVINSEYANEERFVRMLINEAKIAVGLSHVNIAQIFDLGVFEGIYYIAMEYVDGTDVLELVNGLHARGQHVPIEAVAYIGREISGGLDYAHTRKSKRGQPLNIVHRDISPQNILVSRAGEVKVVDFGIAKAVGVTTKTQAGVIKGKVNYMAPEQVMGRPADARTDVFAVGIVLWEMLTSQMVYAGEDMAELAAKVRKAEIKPPSSARAEIPRLLDNIVLKALHKNAQERYQSAHELMVELAKFLSAVAPDYSGIHLARLVETVCGKESDLELSVSRQAALDELMSREDQLHDHHSLIFQPEGRAQLVLLKQEGNEVFPIHGDLVIGRAGDLTLVDGRVSRRHAQVRRVGSCFMLEDLGSSNGTYVNGQRLGAPHALQAGDQLKIGNCELLFQRFGESAAAELPEADGLHTPPEQAVRRLIFSAGGGAEIEHPLLAEQLELSYRLQLGPVQLSGSAGQITRRGDVYWLERPGADVMVQVNGSSSRLPLRLAVGDRIEVDGLSFVVSA